MALHPIPDEPPAKAVPPKGTDPLANRRTRSTATKTAAKTRAKKDIVTYSDAEIELWFMKMYVTAGTVLMPFRPILANQILTSAKKCATADLKIVKDDASIRKTIEAMMTTGKWSAFVIAHLPILLVGLAESRPIDNGIMSSDNLFGLAAMIQMETPPDDETVEETL